MLVLTRTEVGRRLATGLVPELGMDPTVVIGMSPGGIAVAAEIARLFEAPLDVLPACRLDVPGRLRSTFGAIANGTTLLLPGRVAALALPEAYVTGLVELAHEEVAEAARAWRGQAGPVSLMGRTVVLADDGLAEPVLLQAAVRAVRSLGARRVVLAAPTATAECCADLGRAIDARVLLYEPGAPCPLRIQDQTFAQTTGADVSTLVRTSRPVAVAS